MSTPTLPGQPQDSPRPAFSGASQPNRVTFNSSNLNPPSELYVQRDDILVINWMSSQAGQTITVNVRLLEPGRVATQPQPAADLANFQQAEQAYGSIKPMTQISPAGTAYVPNTFSIALSEGYLLSVAVTTSTAQSTRGQTFVKVFLCRGGVLAGNSALCLCADYLGSQTPIGWPYGRVIAPSEGPGFIKMIQVGAPAAGLDWSFLSQTNTRTRIQSLQGVLTAGAAAANRQVEIIIRDTASGTIMFIGGANQNIIALAVANVVGVAGNPSTALFPSLVSIPLPSPCMLANFPGGISSWSISSNTLGIQAADQWGSVQLCLEEWLDF